MTASRASRSPLPQARNKRLAALASEVVSDRMTQFAPSCRVISQRYKPHVTQTGEVAASLSQRCFIGGLAEGVWLECADEKGAVQMHDSRRIFVVAAAG